MLKQSSEIYSHPDDIEIQHLEESVPPSLLMQVSVAHILMHSITNQSFISPLLLSIGLFIHQTTRSVTSHTVTDLPEIVKNANGGDFCHWVADNFDLNEDTQTGHNTTHAIGIITCQVSNSDATNIPKLQVKRQTVSTDDIVIAGDFTSTIKPYLPGQNGSSEICSIRAH